MRRPEIPNVVLITLILAAGCAASLFGQSGAGTGSLAELTAEIRLLRAAVEQSSRTQTQAQALGVFLSAQQSRMLQVTARLDAARKELESISQRSTMHTMEIASFEEQLSRITDPGERAAVEQRTRGLRLELKNVAAQEQQARVHEGEMLQAWQQEEARWNDLIARLQQIAAR